LAAVAGTVLGAAPAWACPSCGPVDERSQAAYLMASALLAAVPLVMIAVGVVVVMRSPHLSGPGEAPRTKD
jgi:hypothetical protein